MVESALTSEGTRWRVAGGAFVYVMTLVIVLAKIMSRRLFISSIRFNYNKQHYSFVLLLVKGFNKCRRRTCYLRNSAWRFRRTFLA